MFTDLSHLFHHYPRSFHDLLHHEDAALVKAGAPGLIKTAPPPQSAIQKDADPAINRSSQNFGLLLHDYFKELPAYSAQNDAGEALLRHWRKILQEQPQRLAEAHFDSWNNERSRHFWLEHLKHHEQSPHFPTVLDDWERSAGTVTPPPVALGMMKTRQWQDLVIRQRIHKLDLYNMGYTPGKS